ncbi:hypothetical protein HY357_01695 [Candidatus Roizmanbacteria bacterium]|nr:hypothetical protein [Candidatus Roizmanbacteria bacterium]
MSEFVQHRQQLSLILGEAQLNAWSKLSPNLRPDIASFESSCKIEPPQLPGLPKLHPGLKREVMGKLLFGFGMSRRNAPDFTTGFNTDTGTFYISPKLFSADLPNTERNLAIYTQIGMSRSMKQKPLFSYEYDQGDRELVREALRESFDAPIPDTDSTHIELNGFSRQLKIGEGLVLLLEPKGAGEFPPDVTLNYPEIWTMLDQLYGASLAVYTYALVERKGDFNKFTADIVDDAITLPSEKEYEFTELAKMLFFYAKVYGKHTNYDMQKIWETLLFASLSHDVRISYKAIDSFLRVEDQQVGKSVFNNLLFALIMDSRRRQEEYM